MECLEAATGQKGPAAALVNFATALGSMQQHRPQQQHQQLNDPVCVPATSGRCSSRPAPDRLINSRGFTHEVHGGSSCAKNAQQSDWRTAEDKKNSQFLSSPRSARLVRGKSTAAAATAAVA